MITSDGVDNDFSSILTFDDGTYVKGLSTDTPSLL